MLHFSAFSPVLNSLFFVFFLPIN